jgi:hypothetical protein
MLPVLDFIDSVESLMMGFRVFVDGGELLNQLTDAQLLQKESASH